jgi:hypothetical protein
MVRRNRLAAELVCSDGDRASPIAHNISPQAPQFTTGQVNLANVRAALDSVVDPTTGKIVCRDPVWVSLGCVPLNLFGYHSITPAAAAWVNANVTENAKIQEQILSASTQGSVGSLPAGNPRLGLGAHSGSALPRCLLGGHSRTEYW